MPRLWSHEQCPVQGTSPRVMLQNMHTASHASAQLYFCSQSEHDLYKNDHEHRMWHSLWKKFPWDPSNKIWSVWLVYLSIPCRREKTCPYGRANKHWDTISYQHGCNQNRKQWGLMRTGEMKAYWSMQLLPKAVVKHMKQQHLVFLHIQDEHHRICCVWQ